jgi:hypothetical protein
MGRRSADAEYCVRAGMALKAMGPRRCPALPEALVELDHPVPLLVIVEVIGSLGHKPLVYRLGDLLRRLSERDGGGAPDGAVPVERVCAKAHLELARVGSRMAIEDLRRRLADGSRPLEIDLLAAVGHIGKKEEIGLLLHAWQREGGYVRERVGDAVRGILKRERIRRNARHLQALAPGQRRALDRILGPTTRARARPRPAARPTA